MRGFLACALFVGLVGQPSAAFAFGCNDRHYVNVSGRIKRLEATIAPQSRIFVFFRAEGPSLPPYAEQLAQFKAENRVGPHDTLVTVVFTFDA
jgi:hypothetical protein